MESRGEGEQASTKGASYTLDLRRGHLLDQASTWTSLHESELRRRATEAARDKNVEVLWDLTVAYLTTLTQAGITISPHTLRSYRTGVRQFLTHAEDRAWNLLRPRRNDAAFWVSSLSVNRDGAGPKAAATVRSRVAAANALYAALRWAEATTAHPFEDVPQPRDRTDAITRRPPHRETVVHRALAAAEREQRTDLRVLILLTAHAGLRIEEALTLTWTQVDTANHRLTVHGKGGKRRIVGISGTLLEALKAHAGQGRDGRLFTFAYRSGAAYHLRRLMEQEGLPWSGFHPFRKYNGTLLYRRTRDFVRVAHHLGHANVNTTRAYVDVPADDLAAELADL
ncbi:integrase [Deinococcus malanensis]|uniref:Integrase n=1 Tax=Deinococcus malanensis TaxID=1706855 RepID=A0ABQ2F2Z9_9DEIO|nr:site-specific integrase [Deinococcus malanensis]GGK42144.1 integrase [Deinococcus malanensis]